MSDLPLARILEFVRKVVPFDTLSQSDLEELLPKIEIAFYPRGHKIIRRGDAPPGYLHLIQVGAANIQLADETGEIITVDIRGEGDVFGAVSILNGKEALFDIFAAEDMIAYLIAADTFKDLVARYPIFERTFRFSLARAFKSMRASADCQATQLSGGMTVDMYLTAKKVKHLMKSDVLTCSPTTSIREAARQMAQRGVASIIIRGDDGAPMGIVSDRDLRTKVIAGGLSTEKPVAEVMSSPLWSIAPGAYAFDALLNMTHYGISHMPVIERGRLVGIISEHDFRMQVGSSPVGVIADIEKARTLEELAGLRQKIDNVRETLLRQVGSIKKMVALITEFNDRVTIRLLTLTRETLQREGIGLPPAPYTWIAMGSEGRLEQTLRTDQDNALVLTASPSVDAHSARPWFLNFAERVVDGLETFGFPRCLGGFMASNPKWCQTESHWKETFISWVQSPSPITLRLCTVFFDLRHIYAENRFAETVWDTLHPEIDKNPLFLRNLAKNALYNIPPLGFIRTFVVEKSGENKNELNLKMKGLTPVVDAARVLALDLKCRKTNTLDRLEAAHAGNLIDDDLYADLKEAYSFIFYLRTRKHLEAVSKGAIPDNFVDPADLNNLQRKMLKESFTAINRLQELIQYRYHTQLIPGG